MSEIEELRKEVKELRAELADVKARCILKSVVIEPPTEPVVQISPIQEVEEAPQQPETAQR